jgi:hypothetical protein
MDLCHNKASPQQEKQRREIADAFRILEEARHESTTAAKFLDSLMHVLRKHKVPPPKRVSQQLLNPRISNEQLSTASGGAVVYNAATTQPYSEPAVVSIPMALPSMLGTNEASSINIPGDESTSGEDLSSYFNELAQSFEKGVDVDSFDWNNIFTGLESSFL